MSFAPLILALALAVAALFLPDSRTKGDAVPKGPWIPLGIALVLVAAAATAYVKANGQVSVMAWAGGLTLVLALAAFRERFATSMAVGAAAPALLLAFVDAPNLSAARLASIAVLGVAAVCFRSFAASAAAIFGGAAIVGSYLGGEHLEHSAGPTVAVIIALVGAAGGLAGQGLSSALLRGAIGGVAATVAATYLGIQVVHEFGVVAGVGLGAVAGLLTAWLLAPNESADGLKTAVVGIIWLGIATISFGFLKGFGMSLALLGALAVLIPTGNPRAILAVGPLAALSLYRLMREAHSQESRALDIGQHYALLGVALGMLLPLLPADANERQSGAVGNLLWGLILGASPVILLLLFGGVGANGFIAGTGFAALVYIYRNREDILPLAVGMGLSGATTLLTGSVGEVYGLTRNEKQQVLVFAAGGLAMVGFGLWLVGRRGTKEAAI